MQKWFVALFLLAFQATATAQTVGTAPWEEFGNRLKASRKVDALGPNLFGDEVSLSNGSLSFSATDVSIPGNSGLPVAFSRSYQVRDWRHRVADGMLKDWDVDLPSISGIDLGTWLASDGSQSRCSVGGPPPSPYLGLHASDYWQGSSINLPGVSSGELLLTDSTTLKPGSTYKWMTNAQVHVSCLTTIQNGTGEGFLAITPDGTRYWFDWMAQHDEPAVNYVNPVFIGGGGPTSTLIARKKHVLYATRVEDRFGNWVTYTYSNTATQPGKLTQINANDGRQITVSYSGNAVSSVTDGTRTLNRPGFSRHLRPQTV